ncbi:Type I restriction-modification system, restriction subunit R, partial [Bathymodiolus heckerae thiotrophic gill symbiont]|uniref:type I restriction endonuclease subunit R n=1 Tax=Bathymodiolus heckerae thiotrophic gill symbiont TaxID=1052212 RepID=UPI0010BA3770
SFSAFDDDAMVRIKPSEIKKKGKVPTNGSIFFTIFQSFMSGTNEEGESEPNFGQYPKDYFDFIIIDECHRGGANDEGNWRSILDYFSPAVQLGLTATPKRKDNVDTYAYFGEPIYVYSLKDGINDGFLTPFKVKRIQTTLDDYIYTNDDAVVEGEIEQGKIYEEEDFNKIIEIKAREAERVKIFMDDANKNDKTIIFCATQVHAAMVRDLVNQYKKNKDPNYCVRVTANDGTIGETFLAQFQDNEKLIPTVLTTSQKLSTGVDARNIRNIVLMRPVKQIIEFKQIVGRGTRLFDGKEFFTIYDFVDAYQRFSDPEWDGEPVKDEGNVYNPPEPEDGSGVREEDEDYKPKPKQQKIKIKLKNGKELEIQHMISTSFWNADGKPISAEEFLNNLFGELPNFFKNEAELRKLWSNPITRKTLLKKLDDAGFGKEELTTLQKLINAENSDLFDVLEYVFNSDIKPITRKDRVAMAKSTIFALLDDKQQEFIDFVLKQYIKTGVGELDQEKLPILLTNKYQSLENAKEVLGDVKNIRPLFIKFQQYLYEQKVA